MAGIKICIIDGCTHRQENEDTGLCASHNRAMRKAENIKIKTKPKQIAKVSGKLAAALKVYSKKAEVWLRDKRCAVWPSEKATEVHHKMGRVGYADEWARQHDIPLLIDERYWLPVSREGHVKITKQSKWAIERGFSILRTPSSPQNGEV